MTHLCSLSKDKSLGKNLQRAKYEYEIKPPASCYWRSFLFASSSMQTALIEFGIGGRIRFRGRPDSISRQEVLEARSDHVTLLHHSWHFNDGQKKTHFICCDKTTLPHFNSYEIYLQSFSPRGSAQFQGKLSVLNWVWKGLHVPNIQPLRYWSYSWEDFSAWNRTFKFNVLLDANRAHHFLFQWCNWTDENLIYSSLILKWVTWTKWRRMNDDWIKQGNPGQIGFSLKSSRELIERYSDRTIPINTDNSMKEADKAIDTQFIFASTLIHISSSTRQQYLI